MSLFLIRPAVLNNLRPVWSIHKIVYDAPLIIQNLLCKICGQLLLVFSFCVESEFSKQVCFGLGSNAQTKHLNIFS